MAEIQNQHGNTPQKTTNIKRTDIENYYTSIKKETSLTDNDIINLNKSCSIDKTGVGENRYFIR
ncbi:hypothetical protein NQ317_013534 [Molorchus minor]|uniref:Uncharacterized protein n=1 Tax=Molorchus minor TaxID=1323400 RepID=A0ABQ9JX03_9CUCU|nr:hypothetical protein NQ317_013534 [Molorchus minor]